jgi:hypothetical protein
VYHPEWPINPVLVPKKNKDWRMCVHYTNLNKACKKDPFGLARIDQVVDGHVFPTQLIVLDGQGIDVILGMSWMKLHKVILDIAK